MDSTITDNDPLQEDSSKDDGPPPFYVTTEQKRELRHKAARLSPSLTVTQASSFDEYARQLMVPPAVMDLYRKAANIRLSTWEIEGIRAELEPDLRPTPDPECEGFLRRILRWKAYGYDAENEKLKDEDLRVAGDASHPPYIRVACTGTGDFDRLAEEYLDRLRDKYDVGPLGGAAEAPSDQHPGDYGSPVVLEIWPAQHYSPIHSHGNTTGIIYSLTGQVDVMAYDTLDWNAEKLGLLTLTPGQCAWLSSKNFAVHKVYCPMDGGAEMVGPANPLNSTSDFAATFHVYLNQEETKPESLKPALEYFNPKPGTRDVFRYVKEDGKHEVGDFTTFSDLSWSVLCAILAEHARFRSDHPIRMY